MALVESLQKAIDYMQEHLLEDIKIEDIAKKLIFRRSISSVHL